VSAAPQLTEVASSDEHSAQERQLRDALRRSEELARACLDALQEGVVLADAHGVIHQINPAAREILGYDAEELSRAYQSGQWVTYDEFGAVLPPERRPMARVVATGETVRGEIIGWRHKQGHLVLLRVNCVALEPDDDDAVPRIMVTFDDVTEQRRTNRLLEATWGTAPAGIAVVDQSGAIVRNNPMFASHTGRDDHDLVGARLDELLPALDKDGDSHERQLIQPDGSEIWLDTKRAEIVELDRPLEIVATFDITARKRLEFDLERFRHLFRNANDIITVLDEQGQVLYASPSNERVLGYPDGYRHPDGVLGMVHPDDVADAAEEFAALLEGSRGPEPFTMRVQAHDGSWRFIETVGTNLLDEPSVRGVVITSRDVTERQVLGVELAHRATHDPLTELPNRSLAEDRISLALARARREGRPVGLCYLDLDGFKLVNDSLGHGAGDDILIEAARRLRGGVRATDIAARIGGDEFVVVLDLVDGTDEALLVAHRLRRHLTEPPLQAGDLVVDVSIGVATSRSDDSPSTLLVRADLALYDAKSEGGACIRVRDDTPATAAI
jgi:diguanylate cyclase (GGDEF)-like protein/PAS domain S-box-containing protein